MGVWDVGALANEILGLERRSPECGSLECGSPECGSPECGSLERRSPERGSLSQWEELT